MSGIEQCRLYTYLPECQPDGQAPPSPDAESGAETAEATLEVARRVLETDLF